MRKFDDDDKAYLDWLTDHPDDLVLNVRNPPSAAYAVLHRATCRTIASPRDEGAYTARGYQKVVAETKDELRSFVQSLGSDGSLSICGLCSR